MTESKTELLGWLNDLLQLNYTRIEQCGTGAAFCQIADSIYGNVPITRVKFQSDTEYDYISNFKILQSVFNKHKIERSVPIDKLVKCRYSDNLEFLQWMKKYWDAFYPGGRYDAAARRVIAIKPKTPGSAKSPGTPVTPAGRSPMKPNMTSERESRTPSVVNNGNSPHPKLRALSFSSTDSGSSYGALEKGTSSGKRTPQQHAQQPQQQSRITSNVNMLKSAASQQRLSNGPNSSTTPTNLAQQQERYINDLTRQVNDLKIAANTLERERNFYYLKLRDLEVLVLDKLESNEEVSFLHEIQTILYATEEGFIRPNKNNPPKLALAPITVATAAAPTINSVGASRRPSVPAKVVPTIIPNTTPVTYTMNHNGSEEDVTRRSSLAIHVATLLENSESHGTSPQAAYSADTEVASPQTTTIEAPPPSPSDKPKSRNPSVSRIPSRSGSRPASAGTSGVTPTGGKSASRPGSGNVKSPVGGAASRNQSAVSGRGQSATGKRDSTISKPKTPPSRDSVPKQSSRPMSAVASSKKSVVEPPVLPKSARGSIVDKMKKDPVSDTGSATASREFMTSGAGAGE